MNRYKQLILIIITVVFFLLLSKFQNQFRLESTQENNNKKLLSNRMVSLRPGLELPNLPLTFNIPHFTHPNKYKRSLTEKQYGILIKLLDFIDAILTEAEVTYFMTNDSLLGSYSMHDILPWNSSAILAIDILNKNITNELFERIAFYTSYPMDVTYNHSKVYNIKSRVDSNVIEKVENDSSISIFFRDGKFHAARKIPWIQFSFYEVENMELNLARKTKVKLTDVFPLHRRPFGPLWLPAPMDTRQILHNLYGEHPFKNMEINEIVKYYPIIKRSKNSGENGIRETLVLKGQERYSVLVNDTGSTGSADWDDPYCLQL